MESPYESQVHLNCRAGHVDLKCTRAQITPGGPQSPNPRRSRSSCPLLGLVIQSAPLVPPLDPSVRGTSCAPPAKARAATSSLFCLTVLFFVAIHRPNSTSLCLVSSPICRSSKTSSLHYRNFLKQMTSSLFTYSTTLRQRVG